MRRRVDAIVVLYFGDQWLDACLSGFTESEPENRIVLADNYGNERVESISVTRGFHRIPLPGPLGFAEANNHALIHIGLQAECVCFLNQDTISPPGWLGEAADFLEQHPTVGALTPLISTYDGAGWDLNFAACAAPLGVSCDRLADMRTRADFHEVPEIPAAAMLVRGELLGKIGAFDPIYGSYYEDYDLCHRIRAAGYKVGIWTGATVAHFSGSATRTPEAESRRQRQIVRNRIIFRVRTEPRGRLAQLSREVFIELPRQVARRVLRRPASKPLGVLFGGYWDAAKVGHRLVSARVDEAAFRRYLKELGWPLSQE